MVGSGWNFSVGIVIVKGYNYNEEMNNQALKISWSMGLSYGKIFTWINEEKETIMKINWEKWQEDFLAVAMIGKNSQGGVDRLAYTDADQQAHQKLAEMAEALGLEVSWDGACNLWITKKATQEDLSPIVFGSHLDTVPSGGKYDGTLGVLSAFHALRLMVENQAQHHRDVTLIVFRSEESSRFNCSTIGSKLLADRLNGPMLRRYEDSDGITAYDEIIRLGGHPDDLYQQREYLQNAYGFIELHIEQGPVLEDRNVDIGIVECIAAPTRIKVDIRGTAAHSGACPMHLRNDALAGAAEIILAVEEIGRKQASDKTVATVGKCTVFDQAINVVPGHVELYIDIRGIFRTSIDETYEAIKSKIMEIGRSRDLSTELQIIAREQPTPLNEELSEFIVRKCVSNHLTFLHMSSGAGHDTMNIADLTRAAMIFLPCVKGSSHSYTEAVTQENIENGLQLLYDVMVGLGNFDPAMVEDNQPIEFNDGIVF